MKDEILYYAFPQLYAQCKVINTLGDLNMIRHIVPEAALEDKRTICGKQEEIDACFLDWSKCQKTFLDEVFTKMFRPYDNLINNLNMDNYETDVDKTKGFLDFQKLLLGVDINSTRLTFMKTIEDDLKKFEDHKFRKDSTAFHVDLMKENSLLKGLIDSEKLAFYKDESYIHTDLKPAPPAPSRVANSGFFGESESGVQIIPNVEPENRVLEDNALSMDSQKRPRILSGTAPIASIKPQSIVTALGRVLNTESSLTLSSLLTASFPKQPRILTTSTPAPTVKVLEYEIAENVLDMKVISAESGINVKSLESSMSTLPAMGDVLGISISDPSGTGGGGGSGDNSGNNGTGDGGNNNTGDKSAPLVSSLGYLLGIVGLLMIW